LCKCRRTDDGRRPVFSRPVFSWVYRQPALSLAATALVVTPQVTECVAKNVWNPTFAYPFLS